MIMSEVPNMNMLKFENAMKYARHNLQFILPTSSRLEFFDTKTPKLSGKVHLTVNQTNNFVYPWLVLTYHGMRCSSYQGNRTFLLIFMRRKSLGSPLIQVSFGSIEATVYNAGFLLKRLTYSISLMYIAQAWFPCQETLFDIWKGIFICAQ